MDKRANFDRNRASSTKLCLFDVGENDEQNAVGLMVLSNKSVTGQIVKKFTMVTFNELHRC